MLKEAIEGDILGLIADASAASQETSLSHLLELGTIIDFAQLERRAEVTRLIDERIPLQFDKPNKIVLTTGVLEEVTPRVVRDMQKGNSPSFTGKPITRANKGMTHTTYVLNF